MWPSPSHSTQGQAGYTLIELLVVIAVLALLAGIIVFAVGNSTTNAQTASCSTERSTIRTALAAYSSDTGSAPTVTQGLAQLSAAPTHYLAAMPDPAKWVYNPSAGDVIGLGTCVGLATGSTPQITGKLWVDAASSLKGAFLDVQAKLKAVSPGLDITIYPGGSSTLKNAINLNGNANEKADVFAAADTLNSPNAPIVASSRLVASNKLVIITRPGNPSAVSGLADLFTPGLQVILCQSAQPCGNAANQAFATIGRTRANLGANLVSEAGNVTLVVTGVTTGAPNTVGLVYVTDAKVAGSSVGTVAIPDANNFVNQYPAYQLNNPGPDANPTGAQQFIDYLSSPEGQAILAARGFAAP